MFNGKRFNSIDNYYKARFGVKVYKLALNIGATCPNRDGSKGYGGCKFCSGVGSGEFAKLSDQITEAIELLKDKATGVYIAYFQSFSNTYMSVNKLNSYVSSVLADSRIVGISIATRADCISGDMLNYLTELNKKTHLVMELGLQTINDNVNELLNRQTSYNEFKETYKCLKERNIKICVHIMDSLPNESKENMLATAKAVSEMRPHSVKIHMLNVLKGTVLAEEYNSKLFELFSMTAYIEVLIMQLRIMNSEIYIERVTGDGDRISLIEPKWVLNKRYFLNELNKKMKQLNCLQGDLFNE